MSYKMITVKDIAWLAGLLEGEGTFFARDHRGGSHRVVIASTDKDVVERSASLMGNPKVYPSIYKNRPKHWKPLYRCGIEGRPAAALMMTIYPLMGKKR